MSKISYNNNSRRIIIIYIVFSLFFIFTSTMYFYKYFKEKYEKNVEFEKIKIVNLITSKEQENLAILKGLIDADLSKITLSEKYSLVKYQKNKDDNFIPIEGVNVNKTVPVTKKSVVYNNLVLHKPLSLITGEKNKLTINTFYREDMNNLYLLSQQLIFKDYNLAILPYYQSINDPARFDVDNPFLLSNQFIIKGDSSLMGNLILFVILMVIIFIIGLWGVVRYLAKIDNETQEFNDLIAELSKKKILDININDLPDVLKELYKNLRNDFNAVLEKNKLFEGIIRSTTNLVILKNVDENVTFVSDSVYKFFGTDINNIEELLARKEFNDFLNMLDSLNDNEEFSFEGHQFIIRKRNDAKNNTIFIIVDITKYHNENANLRKSYSNLKKYLENIESTTYELTSISNELKSTVLNTSSSLSEQSSALSEISSALDEIKSVVKNLDAALEKINGLIEHIEDNSSENIEKLLEFEKVIDRINSSANTISTEIAALSEKAYSVTSFVENIFDIANQTKILAINIAIEAAKTEEGSGKFTVIATEVKELAQKVEALSNNIKKIVSDMTTSVNKTTMSTEESIKNILRSKEYFSPLKKLMFDNKEAVEKIAKSISDINESFKDHAIGINDIATTIKDISQAITDISKSSEETKTSASVISESIIRLREILKHVDNE